MPADLFRKGTVERRSARYSAAVAAALYDGQVAAVLNFRLISTHRADVRILHDVEALFD
jgi:hypothetical protein